ncbi:recombinase RecA [Candidatus Dojkabacteria bacterium]|jgi:recombination protein RecA|nr:recombinase RecA [Candidatus Dojkabacteria bacterium]
MKSDKDIAFDTALSKIRKEYGNDAVMDMDGTNSNQFKVDFVSTGCLSLDRILGGGLPRGRVIEIFGAPSSGKSVLSIYLMAQVQKLGGKAVLVDSEFAFSPDFARKIGLDVSAMKLVQPTTGEEALDIVSKFVEASAVDIIVIDSVASLVPKAELEGTVFDQGMALQARMLSKALRMLTAAISKSKTIVIFINQVREKVGVFYGPKSVSPGGVALKFYSSVRVEIRKGKNITNGDDDKGEVIGNFIGVNIVKNKVAPPFRQCEIELLYELGIDLVADLIDTATRFEIIKRQGNTYSFSETKLGVGREAVKRFLSNPDNSKIYQEIYKDVKSNL